MTPQEIDNWFGGEDCDCGCDEIKALAKLGSLVRRMPGSVYQLSCDGNVWRTIDTRNNYSSDCPTPEEALQQALKEVQ